jgi:hypothetical protein
MKTLKQVNSEVNEMYKELANGVQFNIMDLSKVMAEAERIMLKARKYPASSGKVCEHAWITARTDARAAMREAIAKYRQN